MVRNLKDAHCGNWTLVEETVEMSTELNSKVVDTHCGKF